MTLLSIPITEHCDGLSMDSKYFQNAWIEMDRKQGDSKTCERLIKTKGKDFSLEIKKNGLTDHCESQRSGRLTEKKKIQTMKETHRMTVTFQPSFTPL